jgi:cytochrome c biogenesis protein CcmG, thiol:disulfide interchange protein DsbE
MVPRDELEGYARRSRRTRLAIAAALFVALALAGYLALRPADTTGVPDFRLPLLSGGTLSSDDLRGSPVVINFFASWCAPCRKEARLLEATWRAHRAEGVRFIGVDIRDRAESARRFVREFGISYPVVRDADERLAGPLGVYGLPQTFFVDARWTLLEAAAGDELGEQSGTTTLGAITERELQAGVAALLRRSETRG